MGAMAVTANCSCCASACRSGCAIASAVVAAWRSGIAIVIGVIAVIGAIIIGSIVIGAIVTMGARRCLRAGAGGTESCASVVTASNRDRNDIRVLLGCAPIRVPRESPNAAWATRWIGSCLAG